MSKPSSTEAKSLIYENQKGEGSQAHIGIDCLESSFSKFFMKYLQKPTWAKSAKIYEKQFSATGVIERKTHNSKN